MRRRYFLATHPMAMAKLEAELDQSGLLKTAANPQPRAITYADISKLHYLDLVIKVPALSLCIFLCKRNLRLYMMGDLPQHATLLSKHLSTVVVNVSLSLSVVT